MIFNNPMKRFLSAICIDEVPLQKGYLIWQKANELGQPYWGVDNFCGLDKTTVTAADDLIDLEWAGNEIYSCGNLETPALLTYGLGVLAAWKEQMEQNYSTIPFDISLSIDCSDVDVGASVTLRFWAVRNNQHYILPIATELEKFAQPVLMEQVNYEIK